MVLIPILRLQVLIRKHQALGVVCVLGQQAHTGHFCLSSVSSKYQETLSSCLSPETTQHPAPCLGWPFWACSHTKAQQPLYMHCWCRPVGIFFLLASTNTNWVSVQVFMCCGKPRYRHVLHPFPLPQECGEDPPHTHTHALFFM